MNATSGNSTANPLGLAADTHGSLYKLIGVTLAICSGKPGTDRETKAPPKKKDLCHVYRYIYW